MHQALLDFFLALKKSGRILLGNLRFIIFIGLVVIGGMWWIVGAYFYGMVFQRKNSSLGRRIRQAPTARAPALISSIPPCPPLSRQWLKHETQKAIWTLLSDDQLFLSAIYLPPPQDSKKLAILVHGYRGKPEESSDFALWYHQNGYHVLMPALRAHGQSQGSTISFGWKEKEDLKLWVKKAIDNLGVGLEIVLHGASMGAVTVLMASGDPLPGNVKAIISDSAFTNVTEILSYQLAHVFGLPAALVMPQVRIQLYLKQAVLAEKMSALDQLKTTRLPVLLIHGGLDSVVPSTMVYQLEAAARNAPECTVLFFENAGHLQSWSQDTDRYSTTLKAFLSRHLMPGGPSTEEILSHRSSSLKLHGFDPSQGESPA